MIHGHRSFDSFRETRGKPHGADLLPLNNWRPRAQINNDPRASIQSLAVADFLAAVGVLRPPPNCHPIDRLPHHPLHYTPAFPEAKESVFFASATKTPGNNSDDSASV
jgi:hypothetical protein